MAGGALYFEEVEIGDEIGPVHRVVTDEQVHEFSNLRGPDRGPSRFTDAEVARREGLPGPIVPGSMTIAMISQLLTGWSPTVNLKKVDVVFRQVALHNVPLEIKGIVTDKRVADGEPQVDCDVFMESDAGARLVIGSATVALPRRGP